MWGFTRFAKGFAQHSANYIKSSAKPMMQFTPKQQLWANMYEIIYGGKQPLCRVELCAFRL